jgi:hypothetical protein
VSRHRADVRPRYARIGVLAVSVVVTATAVLGGIGLLPGEAGPEAARAASGESRSVLTSDVVTGRPSARATERAGADDVPTAAPDDGNGEPGADTTAATRAEEETARSDESRSRVALQSAPADSGSGRRVVFSEDLQRVWLVERDGSVARTYLVSGSVTDNLDPGTYAVYSRSERAWGIDDSGTMKWFVRFTRGDNAAIGFHDIPIDDGVPLQTVAQLGTPMSHGCIRQREADARALWDFAPIGTTVVVV